jgi:predicted HD phosphohydrolase
VHHGPDLSLDEIICLLERGADIALVPVLSVSQLDHALQTAALVATAHPGEVELAAAGLVHDIGHLLPGVDDEAHARAGADVVRSALGERVAALVALHVEAKRYLVTSEPGYAEELASDSAASLAHQGGVLSPALVASFLAHPLSEAALALRRADDRAKVVGAGVEGLDHWVPLLRRLSDGGDGSGA